MKATMLEVDVFNSLDLLARAQEYMVLRGGCRLTEWAELELRVTRLVVGPDRTGVLALDPRGWHPRYGNAEHPTLVRVPPVMLESTEGIALVLDRWANHFSASELAGLPTLSYKLGNDGKLKPVLKKLTAKGRQAVFYAEMKPPRLFQQRIKLTPYVPEKLVVDLALDFKEKTDKLAKKAFKGFSSGFNPKLDMELWMAARLMEFEHTEAA